jgi:hypothetical protein
MLNKKYKPSSMTICGECDKEFPNGNSKKTKRRDVRGINTHGAGVVSGMIEGANNNGLQAEKIPSKARGRGVGTEKLANSPKESMAAQLAAKTEGKAKVSNADIKITMGVSKVTNDSQEVNGTYINNALHTVESNFKKAKRK